MDAQNIQSKDRQNDVETIITEFENILENMLKTNGVNVQVALTNALERFKTEMQSCQEYHKSMVQTLASEKTSPTLILQHRVLADIYQSLSEKA